MNPSPPSILFVYDADSGLIAGLKGYLRQVVSPDASRCTLCRLTCGAAGMKEAWRRFVDGLPLRAEFLHRDHMATRYPQATTAYPAVFLRRGAHLALLVAAEEILACPGLDDLMGLIEKKLAQEGLLGEAVPA